MPGDYHVSDQGGMIKTLLGSCVALVFWHPQRHIGAMCHYVLPGRGEAARHGNALSARYADEFILLFLKDLQLRNTSPTEYQVRAYGAANMFRKLKLTCADESLLVKNLCIGCMNVSCRNRQAALTETKTHGFELVETDLGGAEHRYVEFNASNGAVTVRKMKQIDYVERIMLNDKKD